jgi:O-antigen ligase
MLNRIVKPSLIQVAAFCWGAAVYLPVGMTYLAAITLMLAVLLNGNAQEGGYINRWHQVRNHLLFWPLCFFIAWTMLVLLLQPRYAETPSNLFHAMRIALTMVMVLMLHVKELRAALLGWAISSLLLLIIIYINLLVPLPHIVGLRDILQMQSNKSICAAVLLAIFGNCALIYSFGKSTHYLERLGIVIILLVLPVLIWLLPSRTSIVLMLISLAIGFIHYLRRKPVWMALAMVLVVGMGVGLSQAPQLQQRFAQGIGELQESHVSQDINTPSMHNTSWGLRYMLYTQTLNMMAEKPWLGWGIGSWNEQWRQRTPSNVHTMNMPHNDFLWMGAQAGILGMLALLALMLSLLLSVVSLRSRAATASMVASSGLIVAMSFNSALRDAQIGMAVLFVVVAMNAYALGQERERLK